MALSLDIITMDTPQTEAAYAFYSSVFSVGSPPTAAGDGPTADLDLHGTGRLAFQRVGAPSDASGANPTPSGFPGRVLSAVVERPAEVRALLDAAADNGATVVKPPKKELFGEYTAVYRAPDGAVWKLAAGSEKDRGSPPSPPLPTETAVYLGVAGPKASKVFYEALGMRVRHDYGDKFVDFAATDGASRLGLLTRRALAKDVGVRDGGGDEHGSGSSALVLTHTAATREDVDALLAAVEPAGGRVTAAADRTDPGGYAGHFTDPDGHRWRVTAGA